MNEEPLVLSGFQPHAAESVGRNEGRKTEQQVHSRGRFFVACPFCGDEFSRTYFHQHRCCPRCLVEFLVLEVLA